MLEISNIEAKKQHYFFIIINLTIVYSRLKHLTIKQMFAITIILDYKICLFSPRSYADKFFIFFWHSANIFALIGTLPILPTYTNESLIHFHGIIDINNPPIHLDGCIQQWKCKYLPNILNVSIFRAICAKWQLLEKIA